MNSFALEKWYFDTVDAEGRAFIGYSAQLRLFGFTIPYAQSLLVEKDQVLQLKSSFKKHAEPLVKACSIACDTGLFQAHARRNEAQEFKACLFNDKRGLLDWHCLEPRTDMSVRLHDNTDVQGRGYVEKLLMTVKPWKLPMDALLWGRFTGKKHSVVWIQWEHEHPQSWLFIDGQQQASANISSELVATEGMQLSITNEKTLIDACPFKEHTRLLGFVLPASMREMHEQKWLAKGHLHLNGEEDMGTIIHERVTFKNKQFNDLG